MAQFTIIGDIEAKHTAAAISDGERTEVMLTGCSCDILQMIEEMLVATVVEAVDNSKFEGREELSMIISKTMARFNSRVLAKLLCKLHEKYGEEGEE